MSDAPRDSTRYITEAELADHGLTRKDVRRRCPGAVEYTALDGSPCWLREDLAPLLVGPGRGDEA